MWLRRGLILCAVLVGALAAPNPSGCSDLCTKTYQRVPSGSNARLEVEGGLDGARVAQSSYHREVHSEHSTAYEPAQSLPLHRAEAISHATRGSNTLNEGDNWHRADSWTTDDGHGRVHEEEGQVVDGPTKIKYYRKNYTASYSSGDDVGSVLSRPSVSPGLTSAHEELNRMRKEFDSYGREIHRSNVLVGTPVTTNQRYDRPVRIGNNYAETGHQSYETDQRGSGVDLVNVQVPMTTSHGYNRPAQTGSNYVERVHQTYETNHQASGVNRENGRVRLPVRTSQGYDRPTQVGNNYAETVQQTYETNRHASGVDVGGASVYGQQFYVVPSHSLPAVQSSSETHQVYEKTLTPVQSQTIIRRVPIHVRPVNEAAIAASTHSQVIRTSAESTHHQAHVPDVRPRPGAYDDSQTVQVVNYYQGSSPVQRYEEHWSESGHRSEGTVPHVTTGHVVHGSNSDYTRGGPTNTNQRASSWSATKTHESQHVSGHIYGSQNNGDLTLGVVDLGQQAGGADCQGNTGRKFKRDTSSQYGENFDQQSNSGDDIIQQHQIEQNAHLEFGQNQEDLSQQTTGNLEFQQTTQNEGNFGQLQFGHGHEDHFGRVKLGNHLEQSEHDSQLSGVYRRHHVHHHHHHHHENSESSHHHHRHVNQLEFGHNGEQSQHSTQQSSSFGKLEFGHDSQQSQDLTQQSHGFGQHEFHQSSQQSQDLTQQSSGFGKLELGQELQHDQSLTQQSSGFGNLEFGHDSQQTQESHGFGNHELDQSSQQSQDLTQQSSGFGKLEFGHDGQQSQDLTQQSSGFGKLEFGKNGHQDQDLTQQTHSFGQDDFDLSSQQNQGLTQQSSGFDKLEFGHQSQDLTQKTHGLGQHEFDQTSQLSQDTIQQSSGFGKLEIGHEVQHDQDLSQQTSKFLEVESAYSSQQSQDLTQRSSGFGKLELGQEVQHDQTLTQQTNGFGKLEFGSESQQSQDLTQQTHGFGHHEFDQNNEQSQDFTQQSSGFGNIELGSDSQHSQDLTQQSNGFGKLELGEDNSQHSQDLTQQSSGFGKLEFGKESQQNQDLTEKTHIFEQHGFDQSSQQSQDLILQSSSFGELEVGYDSQKSADLTQKSHSYGQHLQYGQASQHNEDSTQQNSNSGKLEIGKNTRGDQNIKDFEYQQNSQRNEDLNKQTDSTEYVQKSKFIPYKPETTIPEIFHEITTSRPYRPVNMGVKGRRKGVRRTTTEAPKIWSTKEESGDTNIPSINHVPFDAQPELDLENHRSQSEFGRQKYSGRLNMEEPMQRADARFSESTKQRDSSRGLAQESKPEDEIKFQPRILEVYGGNGRYGSPIDDSVYANARPNPSATLPPRGQDPWDIREKPLNPVDPIEEVFGKEKVIPEEAATEVPSEITTTTAAPGFWRRVGNKLGNAYEKAKEKAGSIFGK